MKKYFVLLAVILVVSVAEGQKYPLGLKLEAGKEYKQVMTSKVNIVQDLGGQKINNSMDVKGLMVYAVKGFANNIYEMDVRYGNLSITMQLPQGGTMEFSSEKKDESDIFSGVLSEMVNKPFQIKMSQTGRVLEVKNVEALFESAFKKFSNVPAASLAPLKAQLMSAYGPEAFKGNMEMITAIFPEKPVAVGESWTNSIKLASGFVADMASTYKLMKKNPGDFQIAGDSKIQTVDKDALVETNGMKMSYDLSGKLVSEIRIDAKTGWIIEAKINQEISGQANIKENPQLPQGMIIPMTMTNVMVVTN